MAGCSFSTCDCATQCSVERVLADYCGLGGMKARALIRGADLDLQMRKVVVAAFENAWEEVEPQASSHPWLIEAARLTLADITLQLVRNGIRDEQVLIDAAVRAMVNLPD